MILSLLDHLRNGAAFCPIRQSIGLPCPSCGMTRAWLSFVQGNFWDAFTFHPLFLLAPIFLFAIFRKKKKLTMGIAAIFIAVYLIRILFAVTSGNWGNPAYPVSFYPDSLLLRTLQHIANLLHFWGGKL